MKPHVFDDRFYWPSFHATHLARDLFLAFLLTVSPVWRRALCPLTSWIAVLRVPHLRLLEWSSTFLSPSLSVLFSAHSWPLVPRSISVATIVHGVLGDRHRHDKGASKAEPAQIRKPWRYWNWKDYYPPPRCTSYVLCWTHGPTWALEWYETRGFLWYASENRQTHKQRRVHRRSWALFG